MAPVKSKGRGVGCISEAQSKSLQTVNTTQPTNIVTKLRSGDMPGASHQSCGRRCGTTTAVHTLQLTSLLLGGGASSASMLETDGASSPHKDSHAAENAPASVFSRHSST